MENATFQWLKYVVYAVWTAKRLMGNASVLVKMSQSGALQH